MYLAEFIKEEGEHRLAKKLEVSPVTVCQYKNYTRLPQILIMQKIVKLSKGKVSYDEMIDKFFQEKACPTRIIYHRRKRQTK